MSNIWDERYASEEYFYGKKPNVYLKEKLEEIPKGKILLPADGEGRNGVYAASIGWETFAFDSSEEAMKKAKALAAQQKVGIHYDCIDVESAKYKKNSFDVLALIYTHFPPAKRKEYHQKLASFIKPNSMLVIEGFSKKQMDYQKDNPFAGGPKNVDMLYDLEEIKSDFDGFEFIEAKEKEVDLAEGKNHLGKSSVIRILAKKR